MRKIILIFSVLAIFTLNCKFNSPQKGDVDLDGQVTIADALLVGAYAVGLIKFNRIQTWAADFTCDGEITSFDAAMISRSSLGLDIPEFCGKRPIKKDWKDIFFFP
jgi:hypothetical protein